MIKASLASLSDGRKLILLIFFALVAAFIFNFLGYLVIILVYGIDTLNLIKTLNLTSESISGLKILQISQSFGLFIFSSFFLAYLYSKNFWDYFGFRKVNLSSSIIVVLIALVSLPGINFLGSINEMIPMAEWMIKFELDAEKITKAFFSSNSMSSILTNLLMIVIIPAIGEEIFFRGLIQRYFISITKKQFWGIITSAFFFSFFHFQFQGFIPRFALGVLFGYMYVWSGSIWLPIIAHFTNNAIVSIGYILIGAGTVNSKVEDVGGLTYLWPIGLISIVAVAILLMKLKEENTEVPKQELVRGE